jgi:hypothetical protein
MISEKPGNAMSEHARRDLVRSEYLHINAQITRAERNLDSLGSSSWWADSGRVQPSEQSELLTTTVRGCVMLARGAEVDCLSCSVRGPLT